MLSNISKGCIKYKITCRTLHIYWPILQLCAPLTCSAAPWEGPSRGGAVLYRLPTHPTPQLGEDPPVEDPGLCDPPGGTGVTQLVARSTSDLCVVGSSPNRRTEHFGFPQCSATG